MERQGNEMLNPFTHESLVIRNKQATLKKGTMSRRLKGLTVCLIKQQVIDWVLQTRPHFSNQPPFLLGQPSPADTSWTPAQHTRACHMFSGAPSLRLSLMKYASPSADGKAVMSEILVSVSRFCTATVTQQLSRKTRAGGFRWRG